MSVLVETVELMALVLVDHGAGACGTDGAGAGGADGTSADE